ncbi:MAG: ATP-dependent metallopeptidase FtsH/Yme1/Tma family protein, partial [Bryobacteraceae bacterium]
MSHVRTSLIGLALAGMGFLIWHAVRQANPTRAEKLLTLTQFLSDLDAGKIRRVTIYLDFAALEVTYADGASNFRALVPANYPNLYNRLEAMGVEVEIRERESRVGWISALINAAPFMLVLAFWILVMRQMQKSKVVSYAQPSWNQGEPDVAHGLTLVSRASLHNKIRGIAPSAGTSPECLHCQGENLCRTPGFRGYGIWAG